ncbi:hypothetical protein BYT27DRAFT_7249394 [Phlegmacium glaucopus]|nr:hypothetical protein BYT27DRAFT_7249394 [Phlegmacium glaucopus]
MTLWAGKGMGILFGGVIDEDTNEETLDGDVESSSDDDEDDDSDEDDDDEDEEEGEERDGDTADVEHDEPDAEEVVVENAAESMEDQSTKTIEQVQLTDEEPTKLSQDELRSQATAFMGVSKDTTRSPESFSASYNLLLTLPRASQANTGLKKLMATAIIKGSNYVEMNLHLLKNVCFSFLELSISDHFCRVPLAAYKPILAEVEKMLEEAWLDEEEMRRGAAGGGGGSPLSAGGVVGFSGNRR